MAGCLGGGDASVGDPQTAAPSTFAVTVGKAPVPEAPKTTSTLHLLDGSVLTTVEPTGSEPVRIPVNSFSNLGTAATEGTTLWNFTWPLDGHVVRGGFDVKVDVQGIVLNPLAPASGGSGCFWQFGISMVPPDGEQGASGATSICLEEPEVLPPGIRHFQVAFELPTAAYGAGFQTQVSLVVPGDAKAPGARLDLLTGSTAHDSTVTFDGPVWLQGLTHVTLLYG